MTGREVFLRDMLANYTFLSMMTKERGGFMRINKELAMDCPMAAQILNSSSRKKKELIIRLAERQLKDLGYNQHQFRNSEDIRFVIEMMDRGFISGCPVTERRRGVNQGRGMKRVSSREDRNMRYSDNRDYSDRIEDSVIEKDNNGNPVGSGTDVKDFRNDYLEAVRGILGDEDFGSITEGEE